MISSTMMLLIFLIPGLLALVPVVFSFVRGSRRTMLVAFVALITAGIAIVVLVIPVEVGQGHCGIGAGAFGYDLPVDMSKSWAEGQLACRDAQLGRFIVAGVIAAVSILTSVVAVAATRRTPTSSRSGVPR